MSEQIDAITSQSSRFEHSSQTDRCDDRSSGNSHTDDALPPPMEKPAKPEWNAGPGPGFFTRRLMRMAGVDPFLARGCPMDEQQQIKRVGLALLFGVLFQAICFLTGLCVGFGFQNWTIPVAVVILGVMYAYDSKFIATDWVTQGRAFCRSRGLIPVGAWHEALRRPLAIAIRWCMSVFIASTLAVFVLLGLFESDIERHWANVHRAQNAPIVASVTPRYEALLADLSGRVGQSDARLADSNQQRGRALEAHSSVADIDRQLDDLLGQIKELSAAKSSAERTAAENRRNVRAEEHGIRLHDDNTGLPGQGRYYNFYSGLAAEQQVIVRAKEAEIRTVNDRIAELRRQRAATISESNAQAREYLSGIDRQIDDETKARRSLSNERKKLEDERESWINARVREAPGYVALPDGILAKLEGLWIIVSGSALIASLVFSTKVLIILLESAGPIAKVFFTAPGIYAMSVALRIDDAVETEADRRVRWDHWRLIARDRSHAEIDGINAARRRRATASRAGDAVQKIFEKYSWMH